MTMRVAIVGSGFAAWGAALALVHRAGVHIRVLDIGLTRATSDLAQRPVHNAKSCDGSYFCYGINDSGHPVRLESQRLCSSHALGGHSVVYSGALLYPKDHDLPDWPAASRPLGEDYAAILAQLHILHEPDSLDVVFPLVPTQASLSEGPRRGPTSVVGRSRLATARPPTDVSDPAERKIFSLRGEFEDWAQQGALQYTASCYVVRVTSRDGSVDLEYLVDGVPVTESFDAVFLGAGCINTTAIIDRSLHSSGVRHYPIQAPRLAIHAFLRVPWKMDAASRVRFSNGWPELFLEVLAPETGGAWSHTQLTGLNDQILDAIRARLPSGLHPLVGWLRHVIYFALSVRACPGQEAARLSSTVADDGTPQTVAVQEHPSERCPELVQAVRRAVWRHWRTLRMIPFPLGERLAEFIRGNRLGGWHFGGTLPMREQPVRSGECQPTGEVQGLPGVFVLDSSAFPTVPASTIALLTMAHGHRVARMWNSQLSSQVE